MPGLAIPFAVTRARRNPVRTVTRNLALAQGDDVTLELSCYERDGGPAMDLTNSVVRVATFREPDTSQRVSWDYGAISSGISAGYDSRPLWYADGANGTPASGQVNVRLPSAVTREWRGRYAFTVSVHDYDGAAVLAQGIMQVRPGGYVPVPFSLPDDFFHDIGVIDRVPGLLTDEFGAVLTDENGVPMSGGSDLPASASSALGYAVLGHTALGHMALGSGSVTAPGASGSTAALGYAVLGHTALGTGPATAPVVVPPPIVTPPPSPGSTIGVIDPVPGSLVDPGIISLSFDAGIVVTNGAYFIIPAAPYPLTPYRMEYEIGTAGGSFAVSFEISGVDGTTTPIPGLTGIVVSQAMRQSILPTVSVIVPRDARVIARITATTGAPTGAVLSLYYLH